MKNILSRRKIEKDMIKNVQFKFNLFLYTKDKEFFKGVISSFI